MKKLLQNILGGTLVTGLSFVALVAALLSIAVPLAIAFFIVKAALHLS